MLTVAGASFSGAGWYGLALTHPILIWTLAKKPKQPSTL
jgi:hypothetical protein